jgi:3-oxoacyl-[acyl-carrier protein] reductase
MNSGLLDRVAIVTGATGALGGAISMAIARAGANLVIHYRRREQEAHQLACEIEKLGRRALTVQAELTRPDEAEGLVETAEKHFGRVDILINNAGVTRDRLIMDMTPDDWDYVMRVNLGAAFHCLRAAAAPMMMQRSGTIINVSSVTSYSGWPGQSNYAASKAGLDALTRCAAAELARFNIRVNSVAPGMLGTEMSDNARQLLGDRLLQLIPVGRFGTAEEAASLVLFLASDQASYITGETISVRGGLGMGLPDSRNVKARYRIYTGTGKEIQKPGGSINDSDGNL